MDAVSWLRERADAVEAKAAPLAAVAVKALRDAADDLEQSTLSSDAAPQPGPAG